MSPPSGIRIATHGDLAGVLALYRHLNPRDPLLDADRAAAAWTALLDSGLTRVIVADVDGMLAASCTLTVIPNLTRGARPYGVIENVVTHAGFRRAGLGRQVMQAALDAAWQDGCYKVMLASGRDEGVLRFYDKLGFARNSKTFFEMRRP